MQGKSGGSGAPQAQGHMIPPRLAAGPRAQASLDLLLAVGGTRLSYRAGEDGGRTPAPARAEAALAVGTADLRPLSRGHKPRQLHTRRRKRARNREPNLGSELTSGRLSTSLGASVSPLVESRWMQHSAA